MSVLRVYLFGGFDLVWEGGALPSISGAASRSLLAYLLLHHGRPFTRDRLAGLFWGELPDATARRRLSQALWQIRRALRHPAEHPPLPHPLLLTEGDTVQTHPSLSLWLDVEVFRDLLERLRHAPVVEAEPLRLADELYRGDFLEGYYDDWMLVERERLREGYLWLLERLALHYKREGTYETALHYARRLTAEDPLREEAHREVMRLFHLLGRDRAALDQYALLRRLLKEELGVEPSAATQALQAEIAAAMRSPHLPHLPTRPSSPPVMGDLTRLPFVGRGRERALLLERLRAAAQGEGGLVLLEGEAGVGKSRLVDEVAAGARWRGMLVGRGAAMPTATAPYHPLTQALEPLLTPLRRAQLETLLEPLWLEVVADLFPALRPAGGGRASLPPLGRGGDRARLWEGLARLLLALGRIAPLLLVLEDLHWADEATLEALTYLAPRMGEGRIFLLLTLRPPEARSREVVWQWMEGLDRTGAMRRLTLAPFDLAGTAALVGRALGTRRGTTPFVKRLWAETGGNALFLVEMLAALIEQGALRRTADGRWQFPSESAPWPTLRSLQGIVDYRAAQLEPEARALLEALAVLGGEADFPTILQLAEDRQRLLPCLERLKQLGFLRDTETHYCFVHDRIREGLYRAIPAERRRSLHRRVGEVLTALHPQRLDALAHHFEEAGLWDAAVRHHLEAGAQAERMHAPHAAWEHYSRALTLLEEKRPFPAREAAAMAFRAHAARRELSWMLGRTEAEEADIAALLRLADRLLDPVRRAEALNQHAYFLCNTRDDYAAAIRQAEAALKVAEAHDLPEAAARAWRNLGEALHRHGDYRRAETALQRSLEVWASLGGHERELGETQIYLAQVYEQTGEIDASERYGQEAVEAAKRADAPLTLARAYALLARLAYRRADHHACLRYHEASLEQIRRIGHKQNEAVELSNLGLVYWTLRDYGRAVALMEEGLAVYRSIGNRRGIVGAMDNLSGLYLETGRFEEAHAALDEGLQIARDIGFQHTEALLWVTLARLYLDEGRLEEAERALQEAQQIAARLDAPYVGGTVHLGLGLWAWARDEVAEADHHFAQALTD